MFTISDGIRRMTEEAEAALAGRFFEIDKTAERNTEKVMAAFRRHSVSETMFAGTTGYGYNDRGREALDAIYADIFETEAALCRTTFASGTHAIASALFACLSPGQTLLSAVGPPYDTLLGVIGETGGFHGSLRSYGIGYRAADVAADGTPDTAGIEMALNDETIAAVLIQRSRGYSLRPSLTVGEVKALIGRIRALRPDVAIVVDNCYGEFVETDEPGGEDGADLVAGSLIKNPGGGLAPTGGYVAGRPDLVERAAFRMTAPGLGGEVGATLGQNRALFQGLFLAPHVVAQALKTASLCASLMEKLGHGVSPRADAPRADIVQTIRFSDAESMQAFCRGIQRGAPVDGFVTPVPASMPGYDHEVIMAAGAFIQGSSIELSCDAPMREPYTAFLQGGLTYESGRLGIMLAVDAYLRERGERA